jgi:hypothetical protein
MCEEPPQGHEAIRRHRILCSSNESSDDARKVESAKRWTSGHKGFHDTALAASTIALSGDNYFLFDLLTSS